MKYILSLLLFVFFSLIESAVYPIPFLLYFCIGWIIIGLPRPFLLAFLCGIVIDFVSGRSVGFDSLFFLLSVAIIYIYRKRIRPHTLYYLVPFTLFITAVYRVLLFGSFDIMWFILSNLLALLIYGVFFYVSSTFFSKQSLSVT